MSAGVTVTALLPCPFCGGEADPKGWLRGDGVQGPECEGCGATAEDAATWNTRLATEASFKAREARLRWVVAGFLAIADKGIPRRADRLAQWNAHVAEARALLARANSTPEAAGGE